MWIPLVAYTLWLANKRKVKQVEICKAPSPPVIPKVSWLEKKRLGEPSRIKHNSCSITAQRHRSLRQETGSDGAALIQSFPRPASKYAKQDHDNQNRSYYWHD